MTTHDSKSKRTQKQLTRRPRYRTLREDYVEFCGGNIVAALLLDYFASVERLHDEQRIQGERPSPWRSISGKFGGQITIMQPTPKRETVYRALNVLIDAGLIEAHPENGQQTRTNETPVPNRFRLIARRLLQLERDWSATSHAENDEKTVGGVLSGTYPPVLSGTHESEVIDREYAPLPEPLEVRLLANDTAAQTNGWQLVDAYAEVTGMEASALWPMAKKTAAGLARAKVTPDDVRAFMAEMKADPKQSFRYNGYRFNYLGEDLPRWKGSRSAAPSAPIGPWGRELT